MKYEEHIPKTYGRESREKRRFPALGLLSSDSSRLPHPPGRLLGRFRPIWADFGPTLSLWCRRAIFHVGKVSLFRPPTVVDLR